MILLLFSDVHSPGMCTNSCICEEWVAAIVDKSHFNPAVMSGAGSMVGKGIFSFSGSMFNLSPQILSECACIQANRSHKKEKLCRLLRTASLRFADFLCARVCVGRQRRLVHVYVVCACSYASLCVRLKKRVQVNGACCSAGCCDAILPPLHCSHTLLA